MVAIDVSRVEAAEETKRSPLTDANDCLRDSKTFFRQPTLEEVSRLTFGSLREIRIHTQEQRNEFAHLLNRGSSQE
jgi:hypothetical protein